MPWAARGLFTHKERSLSHIPLGFKAKVAGEGPEREVLAFSELQVFFSLGRFNAWH